MHVCFVNFERYTNICFNKMSISYLFGTFILIIESGAVRVHFLRWRYLLLEDTASRRVYSREYVHSLRCKSACNNLFTKPIKYPISIITLSSLPSLRTNKKKTDKSRTHRSDRVPKSFHPVRWNKL